MSDILILTGVALVVGGAWWMYPPAGVVAMGVVLVAMGVVRGMNE